VRLMFAPTGSVSARRAVPPARRTYLLCAPLYFDVNYSINPWMDSTGAVSRARAIRQWERLATALTDLGHRIEMIDPVADLPDMVFAANGAVVSGDRAMIARFRHPQRRPEEGRYRAWFERAGWRTNHPAHAMEGAGDALFEPGAAKLFAGFGPRSDGRSHPELARWLHTEVVSLQLVDPRYYHLDTAFSILDQETAAYVPSAFSAKAAEAIEDRFPRTIRITRADAEVLAANAISDGRHVICDARAEQFQHDLANHGFATIPLDASELRKAGGGLRCCVLELAGPT
jgi:N-dimethylarginine dimethylaminohydrolase